MADPTPIPEPLRLVEHPIPERLTWDPDADRWSELAVVELRLTNNTKPVREGVARHG